MTDWRDKLLERYVPTVFPAIEVGDGWRPLVEAGYDLIDRYNKGVDEQLAWVDQVKEKFGGLRFYFGCADSTKHDELMFMISGLEEASLHMCERCGAYGKQRDDGWVHTLCDSCDEARKEARNA